MSLFGLKKKEIKLETTGQTTENTRLAKDLTERVGAFSGSGRIIRPIVSEKALAMEKTREYVFQIDSTATKTEVKKEIEKKYGVKVTRVNINVAKPKSRVFRGKVGYRSGFKKAMIKLATGQKLEVYPK